MYMDLKLQATKDMTLPPMPVKVFTSSALPLEIIGIPDEWCGGEVTAVSVSVTNANGVIATGSAVRQYNGVWYIVFAGTNFANYGTVSKGVKVTASISREVTTNGVSSTVVTPVILAVADFEIVASTASATPGSASTFYVVKGDKLYVMSRKVGDVQHYVLQTMEYDAAIGWGANWTGDYILNNAGEFVEYTEAT